jgi:hypothetical protein
MLTVLNSTLTSTAHGIIAIAFDGSPTFEGRELHVGGLSTVTVIRPSTSAKTQMRNGIR